MTEETPDWLDYSKPPPGWSPVVAMGFEDGTFYRSAPDSGPHGGYRGETKLEVIAAAWAHFKVQHDPPGMRVIGTGDADQTFDGAKLFYLSHTNSEDNARARLAARVVAWARHDRRRAIVLDINEQTGGGLDVAAMLSRLLLWTDAECEEVERYAALPFPRSIDMPQPLQRVLLPEATTT